MLQHKRSKFRNQQNLRNRGLAYRGNKVSFVEFGLQATSRGRITASQIEAGRRAISRHIKRVGKILI
ncbi:ribosomal protein L16, partial [Francisella tularensis subsp. holarctica]|uniref:large ribosomal subunit protein uL16 n=1 Tax=Francisella tularensis TaxID=263 RepID=UPI002381BA2A